MPYLPDQAFERISEAHARGRLAHAYLITGPKGSGKEMLACRMIGMAHQRPVPATLDAAVGDGVTVLRPASRSRRIRVQEVHQLEDSLRLTVGRHPVKFGVIMEADRLMEQAQNTFLKTLEEPPKNTLLLLLTEAPERLLPTILSRCIEVALAGPARPRPDPDSAEARLLDLLAQHGTLSKRGLFPAFILANGLAEIFADRKAAITARHEAVFKEETASLRQTTGDIGDWLEERERAMEAMIQADYLGERDRLMATLLSWFGDAIRLQSGANHLDLPEKADALAILARNAPTSDLLHRQAAMERLQDLLATNTSETLAVEVCFLKAFA